MMTEDGVIHSSRNLGIFIKSGYGGRMGRGIGIGRYIYIYIVVLGVLAGYTPSHDILTYTI